MLLDRAAGLSTQISQYQKLKGSADEAGQFRTRAKQLGDASDRLKTACEALRRFKAAGIQIAFSPIDAEGLAAKAQTLRAAIRADPNAIGDPPFDLKFEFTERLKAISDAIDGAIASAWRLHAEKQIDQGSDDVLNALAAIPQFKVSVDKIRQWRAQAGALSRKTPEDPERTNAELASLATAHRAAWANLSAEGIPDTTLGFLRACANEGASLQMLTDEIRAWLKARGLADAFRIKIR